MTTVLEQSRAELVGALQSYQGQLQRELAATGLALEALQGAPEPAAREPRPARRQKAPKVKRAAKAKKARKAPAAPTASAKRLAPDEPRTKLGRLPSRAGVRSLACENDTQRVEKVTELRKLGLRRVSPMERLQEGTYDVLQQSDGTVVLWIEKAA